LTTKPSFLVQKAKKIVYHSKKRRKIITLSTIDEVRDAFTSICQQFQKSFNQGDVEGLASLYLEDAKILPPNMDLIEGKDTIQTFWQGALDMGIKSYAVEMIEVESSGN
jgi:ketosteroid isomerase-like protein